MKSVIVKSTVLALVISVVNAPPVSAAYIDPNTGGMLFQFLAVVFALFSGILLVFSARIRMAFARLKRRFGDWSERAGLSKKSDSES
jgi:hypothetical protein